jgi:hypothetical protein
MMSHAIAEIAIEDARSLRQEHTRFAKQLSALKKELQCVKFVPWKISATCNFQLSDRIRLPPRRTALFASSRLRRSRFPPAKARSCVDNKAIRADGIGAT